MPARAGLELTARVGAVRGYALGKSHVLEGGLWLAVRRRGCNRLQFVVGHAGEEIFGVAVEVEIVTGNAHAPDPQGFPAFFLCVQGGRLIGINVPHLLLPAFVIFAVIGNAKAWRAGPVPIGE